MKVDIPVVNDPGKTLSWIIRGFFGRICEVYRVGAPRRIEAYTIVKGMVESALLGGEISSDDAQEILTEIDDLFNYTFP